MNRRCTYVVAYDIRSPRRLARVAKVLSEIGFRLQYSVFAADLTEPARTRLIARLRTLIDPAEDDVRIYLVPVSGAGGAARGVVWPCAGRGRHVGFRCAGGDAGGSANKEHKMYKTSTYLNKIRHINGSFGAKLFFGIAPCNSFESKHNLGVASLAQRPDLKGNETRWHDPTLTG